jgi:hypothetical protein
MGGWLAAEGFSVCVAGFLPASQVFCLPASSGEKNFLFLKKNLGFFMANLN